MDQARPPPSLPPTTEAHSDSLSPLPNIKSRLMCSYGGHIVPRPYDKSLCYVGGDTRIVSLDRRTTATSLSALTSQLSRTLYNNRPFLLKYQLPNEELDSLISVTTDEDLHNMLEEHDRIVSSFTPSRIRLFLFPTRPESLGSILMDQKTESWFCDALKNSRIVERGQSADSAMVLGLMGVDGLGVSESSAEAHLESGGGEATLGLEFSSGPESLVMETCSSIGSTNSSISMTNLPPIGIHGEDGVLNLSDKKVKGASSGSIESDTSFGSAAAHLKMGIYQEPIIDVASSDSSLTIGMGTVLSDPSYMTQMQRPVQISGYALSNQLDQKQQPQQQEVSYVQAGAQCILHYPAGPLSVSSCYPMYPTPVHQQQQRNNPYQPNQLFPFYLVPVGPMPSYNMSMQSNLMGKTASYTFSRPPLHHNTAVPVACKEVAVSPLIPESAPKMPSTVPMTSQPISMPSNQNQQQFVNPPEVHHQLDSVATTSVAAADYDIEFHDELAYSPIYKTQPLAPALLDQYQTMTKTTTVLLSDNTGKQQVVSRQPQ